MVLKNTLLPKNAPKKLFEVFQNGFCEFVLFLIYICVNNIVLLLALIYKNKSHDLQDIWFENFDILVDKIYFIVITKN